MRFRDKNGPLHHPILKPANLPDFLTVARMFLTKTAKGQFVLKPGSGSASKANTKLILAEEDNIQHILASLALKVTRQSVIIAKLSLYPRKNRTKKALWELDNLRRSLHLLNYVDSPQFQRNIQRALNRGESYHKLVRAVAYANGGKLRVRTDQEQQQNHRH